MPDTVLQEFGRTIREEPLFYIYKYRIYVEKDEVPRLEVSKWLKMRYVQAPRGHRYRIVTYLHANGERYVDCILLETINDKDLVYLRLRWGWTDVKVMRGNRVKSRRLNKEQAAEWRKMLAYHREQFEISIEAREGVLDQ